MSQWLLHEVVLEGRRGEKGEGGRERERINGSSEYFVTLGKTFRFLSYAAILRLLNISRHNNVIMYNVIAYELTSLLGPTLIGGHSW